MSAPDTPPESERVGRIYAGYAAEPRRARAWSPANPGNRAIRRELRKALLEAAAPVLAGSSDVLDVGCGEGWWLAALAEEGTDADRLHGVDVLEARVAGARRRVPNADVRAANALDLPWNESCFGLITFVVSLSSLADQQSVDRALREAKRVLAPRGRIVVYEPRYPNPLNPHTVTVGARTLRRTLGLPSESRSLTLAPPLARRLGTRAPSAYGRLAAIAPLRTHALSVFEPHGRE